MANNLIFATNSAERLRIDDNGRVGINTGATIGASLDVKQRIDAEAAAIIRRLASGSTGDLIAWLDEAAAALSRIDAKGSLKTAEASRVAPWIEPEVVASAATTINSTTRTDITGATVTFTPKSDCRIQVTAFFDMIQTVAGGDIFVGELLVNGAAEAESAQTAIGARHMIGQVWNLPLTGGTSYTIKLTGKLAVDTGTDYQVAAPHTKFSLIGIGRF